MDIAHSSLVEGGVIRGPGFDPEYPTRFVVEARCAGDDPDEMFIDVYERNPDDDASPPPGACPPPSM